MTQVHHVSMNEIYTDGNKVETTERYTRYLTPEQPLKFDANKWRYHYMPDVLTFKGDMLHQQQQHRNQNSQHLNFEFPVDVRPSSDMLRMLRENGFELGCVEMYAIEGTELAQLTEKEIVIKRISVAQIEDYFKIFNELSASYGQAYIEEANRHIHNEIVHGKGQLEYYVAYDGHCPVGILNLIQGEHTLELDGFAVHTDYQRKGYGTRIQAQVGKLAGKRTVVLVADSEDTAKEMYIKQGYTYLHYRYSALLELK